MSFLRILALITLVSFHPMESRADSTDELNQILGVFNSSCPSNGQWTKSALSFTNSIVDILKQIQADPDCRSISGSLSDMQLMSSVMTNLSQDDTQNQITSLTAQQKELLVMIAQSSGNMSDLLTQLQSVNVQLAAYQANAPADARFQNLEHQGRALSFLVDGTKNILHQASQNEGCLKKNRALLPAIAGLAGSIGASLLTGGGSLYVAAGADIINAVVEGSRTHRIARQIRQLSSGITATAFSCVLEGMSKQWCSAEDAQSIVKLKANSIVGTGQGNPIETGIKTLGKDYPKFMGWLSTVSAGSDPATIVMGNRQADFLSYEFNFKAGRTRARSMIAEERDVLANIVDPNDQWKEIKAFVNKLRLAIVNSASPDANPFYSVVGSQYAVVTPWLLVGVPETLIPLGSGSNSSSLDPLDSPIYTYQYIGNLVGNPQYRPSLDVVRVAFEQLANRAAQRLETDRARIMYTDPCKLVANAATPGINGTSPYQSLQNLIEYLQNQQPLVGNFGSFRSIYFETGNTLAEISRTIEISLNSTCTPTSGQLAINKIYTLAHLDSGIGYLSDRLNWAIKLSLDDLVVHSQGTTPTQAAALLAADDIVNEMNNYSMTTSYDDMIKDMKHSQLLLDNTLTSFSNNFSGQIYQNLVELKSSAESQQEGPTGKYTNELNKTCLLLLSIPEWPASIPREICLGRSQKSEFTNWPSSAVITSDMMDTISATRPKSVCAYRDYSRSQWLFEKFHQRN